MRTNALHRFPIGLLALACLGCLSGLHAGELAKGARSCRVLFVNRPKPAGELTMHDGKVSRVIELRGLSLSERYSLPDGDVTLRFATEPANPVDGATAERAEENSGEAPEEVSGDPPTVEIPAAWRQVYLILEGSSPEASPPFTVRAFDASRGTLKAGEMLWINLTGATVSGTLGTQEIELGPQARLQVDAPASESNDYLVDLTMQPEGGTRALPLCRSNWRSEPNARMVVLVFAEPGRRTPRVMAIPDRNPLK